MKKIFKKLICTLLSIMLVVTATACGGDGGLYEDEDVTIDSTKTTLYVGLVPCGYGNAWLNKAIARFEEEYKSYSFETGKTGVQVVVDDVSYGNTIGTSLKGARYQVIYTSDVNYNDLITNNLLYDMTSIVNEKFADTDDNGSAIQNSIGDKFLTQDQRDVYSYNGKIYGIPFVTSDDFISYDRDLFEEKGWFFAANDAEHNDYTASYTMSGGEKVYDLVRIGEAELSMGRDGIAGTYDDGLPATYEQFYFLMKTIAEAGVTPITWSGMYPDYLTQALYAIWANNEGAAKMKLNYTFNGTADDLVSGFDASGKPILYSKTITDANGYLLHNQVGKYYALEFLDNVIQILKDKDSKGYDMAFKTSVDHLGAQDNFLKSVVRSENDSANYKRIAMFHDGVYWENEASSTFEAMGAGYGKMERKIGVMPYPAPIEEGDGQSVCIGSSSVMMFMNGNIDADHVGVATKFVQFMHTRKSLVEFTQCTSMIEPYKFNMTEAEMQNMSYYGKNVYEKYMASLESDNYLNPMSNNPYYTANYSIFSIISSNNWKTKSETLGNTDIPSDALKNCTAREYFEAMQAYYTENYWTSTIYKK